jgi:hypothetical protein
MGATPKYGIFRFKGVSGKTYSIEVYVSDVANALITFDGGAGAGSSSPTFWIAPENCVLEDYSQVTGTADTEKLRLVVNGKPLNQILRYDVHVSTNSDRPKLAIGITKGAQLSAFQIAD